jgi:hypothetical protein
MTKTQAPEQLRLHDNGVDVTARHLGTTIVLVGARPEHLSAKVTSAPTAPNTAPPRRRRPAG